MLTIEMINKLSASDQFVALTYLCYQKQIPKSGNLGTELKIVPPFRPTKHDLYAELKFLLQTPVAGYQTRYFVNNHDVSEDFYRKTEAWFVYLLKTVPHPATASTAQPSE